MSSPGRIKIWCVEKKYERIKGKRKEERGKKKKRGKKKRD